MRMNIRVVANSKRDSIVERDCVLVVYVKEQAKDNRANLAVIKLLSKHFDKSVRIVSGFRSRRKVVEISE
jgi:uncharacterized protein (TIGR00251 family)